jgi:prolyl-tRNA synthetase
MTYTDAEGNEQTPIMGCYGIGVGRLAASVCEAMHDEYGPIWPISIAPWEVHLCCMRVDQEECKNAADDLYRNLQNAGIEVIYDDREVRAGAMFADADLLGVPIRIVVGPKNLKNNQVELVTRDKRISKLVDLDKAMEEIQAVKAQLFAEINEKVSPRI